MSPRTLLPASVLLVACGGGPLGDVADATLGDQGFDTPESALHDADADVYLVSNIDGDPFGKLWVADLDEVRRFDRRTGAPRGSVPIPGATFLNDVAVGPDGSVYVSDTGLAPGFQPSRTDAIWRIDPKEGTVHAFARGADLGQRIAAGGRNPKD